MKVFISSVISGMESLRHAARDAVTTLRHEPVMAEDFSAQPSSPQVACLTGVRQSDLVVLILGEQYGALQPSGISATHEEYREAQGRKQVIAFVQEGVDRDRAGAAFVAEVQGWEKGLFRGSFSEPDDLRVSITRALHDYELAMAVAPVNQEDIVARALSVLPVESPNYVSVGSSLALAVAPGPTQSILRPIEIERASLADALQQEAMFGKYRLFDHGKGCNREIDAGVLVLEQDRAGRISLDEQGTILMTQPADRWRESFGLPVLIEEVVHEQLLAALGFAAWLLESIDATQRLTHVAIAASISGHEYMAWRTRNEHDASSNRVSFGRGGTERAPVHVFRPRAALRLDASRIVEDLLVPLRRQWKR